MRTNQLPSEFKVPLLRGRKGNESKQNVCAMKNTAQLARAKLTKLERFRHASGALQMLISQKLFEQCT